MLLVEPEDALPQRFPSSNSADANAATRGSVMGSKLKAGFLCLHHGLTYP